jgi:cell division protein FtsB
MPSSFHHPPLLNLYTMSSGSSHIDAPEGMIHLACVYHSFYLYIGVHCSIALDNLDVPLRVLFEGTTTMVSLFAALATEQAKYKQLKEDNDTLQAKNNSLEETILFHNSIVLRYVLYIHSKFSEYQQMEFADLKRNIVNFSLK